MSNDPQQDLPLPFQKIVFKEKAQEKLLEGAEVLASAVSSTMGPSGHSVIIDSEYGGPTITKDGVTVARSINLKNRMQSIGAELLKEIASKTNDLAGDGTTTATVLGHSLLKEGNKLISSNRSAIELKRGMDEATKEVIDFLKSKSILVSCKEDIVNVGTISANGDREIGKLISNAIETVGVDGLIAVEPAKSVKTTLKLAEGIQLNSGFLSPFFVTNQDKQTSELENPYVLITANKIASMKDLLPLLEQIDAQNRPLLIVADDVVDEAMHTLVVNHTNNRIKVCAIKAPSYGEHRADILKDLSVVINGSVLGATNEVALKNIKLDQLGTCKKVITNRKNATFLVDGEDKGAKERIGQRADEIRNSLKEDHTLDALRQSKFRERLARLSGGIAIIQVGGSTETEIKEKKDRVEDAVNATQAAAQEGLVPGGGTALFYAAQHLKSLINAGSLSHLKKDEIEGYATIATVCESPFRTIIKNTGESADVVLTRLKENWAERTSFYVDVENAAGLTSEELGDFINSLKDKQDSKMPENNDKFRFGYNAATKEYGDLIKDGIIDPVKVTRYALSHAVSVIGLVLTCDAVILNEYDDD